MKDKLIEELIQKEFERQRNTTELIASENMTELPNVKELSESVKYTDEAEGLFTNEELVDNGRITKVTVFIPHNSCALSRHWTQEDIERECSSSAYYTSNVDGGYIGAERDYERLVKEYKLILIQKIKPSDVTCSIGYSPETNKWYGWSPRALRGFTIRDIVKEGDLTATSGLIEEYRIQHPEEDMSLPVGYVAKDLNGAKRMAIAFAEAVS